MEYSVLRQRTRGFTLTEILIVVAIVAVLLSVAVPSYEKQREKARIAVAVSDIGLMGVGISRSFLDAGRYPDSLDAAGYGKRLDPWGRPYQYVNLANQKGNGTARKDKKLAPLNTDFDLYSQGKDGDSKGPLNAKASRDDVVRARDGKFIGLATDFDP